MKFRTTDLIAAVEAEIVRRTEVADEKFATAKSEYEQLRSEWLASDNPKALADAARKIVEKVRKGRLVRESDVREFDTGYYRSRTERRVFTAPEPKRTEISGATPNLGKLDALRDFLMAVSDDEISSTGLREVGFRNIAEILRAAAAR